MDWVFRADAPIYTQLCEFLTVAIVSGVYAPGDRLPAVRDLAVDAGVNPNTVQRALAELERRGLVYSQRTAGRFVTENTALIEQERERLAVEQAIAFLTAMDRLGYSRSQAAALLEHTRGVTEA